MIDLKYRGRPWAPRNGLVGWWPLNEGTGTTTADRAGNATGTLVNTPTWTAGKFGNCLSFTSGSRYVTLGTVSALNPADKTFSAWVTPSAVTGLTIFGGMSSSTTSVYWGVGISSGKIWVGWSSATSNYRQYTSNNTLAVIGTPIHVVASISSAKAVTLFVNGQSEAVTLTNQSGVDTLPVTAQPFSLGRIGDYDGFYYLGTLDDPRVYSRVLSAAEIAEMYQRSK